MSNLVVEAQDNFGVLVDVQFSKGKISNEVKIFLVGFGPQGGVHRPYEFSIKEAEHLRDKLNDAIIKAQLLGGD